MMKLRRCKEGHFYDADKYTVCPHCNAAAVPAMDATIALKFSEPAGEMAVEEAPVVRQIPEEEINHTLSLEEAIREAGTPLSSEEKTVSFYREKLGTEPVVGWLTCIEGRHYGKSFGLRSGRTFIGRDTTNDVVLDGDTSVSREKHAIVIYDPRAKCFIAQPGGSRELYYLNEKVLLSNEVLHPYDILWIGNEKLLFIPMCGERFCWEDTNKGMTAAGRAAS